MSISEESEPRSDAAAVRRKAFVDQACASFFAHGYAGTTMSSVAAGVGGSKTTLWTYFPSKEDLFAAVLDDIVERHGAALSADLPFDGDVAEILRAFGDILMRTLLASPMIDLHRLVIGEARRFPHLAQLFYDRAPARGKAKLAAYFEALMARSRLRKGDPMQAVHQFVGLCQGGHFQLALLGLGDDDTEAALARDIAAAVDIFCSYWRHPAPPLR